MQWNVNLTIFFTEPLFCSRPAKFLMFCPLALARSISQARSHALADYLKKTKTKTTPVYTLNRLPLFCGRFINHNPLDCDHATTYTLKHVVIEIMKLKSFDGHKIKCLNLKRSPYGMAGKSARKETTRTGFFMFDRAKNGTTTKKWKRGRGRGRKETVPFFPSPLCSFTCAIFARALTLVPRFFAPKLHGNACYAG